jgi:hypothetical protein
MAVLLAAMASWLIGAAWYTLLARPWLIALGKTRTELVGPTGKASPVPFVVAFVAQVVMAGVLAGILAQTGRVTVVGGLLLGLFAWLGFVITTLTVNHGFSRQQVMLTVIDGGHWLAALLVQGAIIGLFGA